MPNGTDIAKAYVQIIPSAEGIKGKLTEMMDGEAETAGKQAGGRFGKVFGVAAKAKMLATGAIATTLTALVKSSLDKYAEYEQLVGGVEKIFDEANQAQILKDANEAYKYLNMSANEYLTSINKTGATFAMTMGDQKGYDTAKKGMQAIADFASGTGANLDLLNEKYGMITRSAASYQSISDQFSGILPSTSKDFLEQAQAAGFLSDAYKSLTEVPIAEYQQAVTAMLEKGVHDAGLLGNTYEESTKTISGSLAMTKAAWSNFVTGLANENANIEELTQNLVNSAVAVARNIFPAIGRILSTIGKMLADAFVNLADKALTAGATVIVNFLEGTASKISDVVQMGIETVRSFINGIIERMIDLFNQGVEIAKNVIKGVTSWMTNIIQKGRDIVSNFISGIRGALSQVVPIGRNLVEGIWQGISNGLGWIKARISGWVGDVVSFIKRMFKIGSPSKLMRDEVGVFLAQGIGVGFEEEMVNVNRMMKDALPDTFKTTATVSTMTPASRFESPAQDKDDKFAAIRDEIRNMKIYLDTGVLVGAVDGGLQTRAMTQARRALA